MKEILDIRMRIDEIDEEIVALLKERIELCRKIGELKRLLGMEIVDRKREKIVFERAGEFKDVFAVIVEKCKEVQKLEHV
ncbi:MAG: chorismate mutase [Thermoprotei archaeon]|nr:MAG: chorismate mutase [Thermoprotei archaeon]